MKADEKACPRCAGTIKKAAHLCKHCGHRFSEGEIAAGVRHENKIGRNIGVACAVGLVALVGLFAMVADGSDDDPTDQSADPITTGTLETSASEQSFADVGQQFAWIEASKEAVRQRLRDPESARFRNVRFYSGGVTAVACGEVNGKNAFGAYEGYERFVAAGPAAKLATLETDMKSTRDMNMVWKEMCVKAPTDEA